MKKTFSLCQCGCGRKVLNPKSKWIVGHNNRDPEKRMKNSLSVRGENNPFYGRKHSKESLQKMSENSKGQNLGKVPWNKGKIGYCEEEVLKKISESSKERWKDPEYRKRLSKIHSERTHSEETKLKMSESALSNWENNEERKKQVSEKLSGENNPNWQGGIGKEPYCQIWTKWLKEQIKERDNHKCQNPDCYGECKELIIHHIDYNKKNCSADNLITLCRSCNSRANTNRGFWKFLFSSNISFIRYS